MAKTPQRLPLLFLGVEVLISYNAASHELLCLRLATGEPMSRRHRNTTIVDQSVDSVLTWLFAGLTIIALVAGILAQITT
jgi:hypothetical protein